MTPPDRQRVCKPSGVRWLPDLPTDWGVTPLKHLVEHVNRGESPEYSDPDGEHELLPTIVVNQACVQWDGLRLSNAKHQPSDIPVGKGLLQPGDVLVNSTGTGTLGRVQVFFPDEPDRTYMADSHVTIVRTQRTACEPRFLARLLSTPLFQGFVYSAITSGATNQIELSREGLARMPCIQPPIAEQTAIADFLDHETARIDALIAKQERLTELLLEKRSSVVSGLVTKGLDASRPMKDSGVDWLGSLPAHWRVVPYKYVTSRVDVGIAEAATQAYVPDGVPIVRSTNVRSDGIELDNLLAITPEFAERNRSKYLRAGDVVTVRTGNPGTSAVVPPELDRAQCFTLLVATPRRDVDAHFLSHYLNSSPASAYFDQMSWGSAQRNISVPILQEIPVAVPGRDEQIRIVTQINEEVGEIDALISKAQYLAALLAERRTAVITAAVTGEIDVRHWRDEASAKLEMIAGG